MMSALRNPYFVAVARCCRNSIPENWLETISSFEDVDIVNASRYGARINATTSAVERIRASFKDALLIEEIIERRPANDS